MSSLTSNYGFYKPDQTEQFNIDLCVNNNMDAIDLRIKETDIKASNAVNAVAVAVSAGDTKFIAGDIVPTGWLEMNGELLSTYSYPELFNAIGYKFGGSGSTFKLPDTRGRTMVGQDLSDPDFSTLGKIGGAKTHSLTEAENGRHFHTMTWMRDKGQHGGIQSSSYVLGNNNPLFINPSGEGKPHNNLQPYQVFKGIIKY